MPPLSLADVHRALGAELAFRGGASVPLHYGDPHAEHRAARESAALFDMAATGKISVGGPEHLRFLDGLVTAHLRRLQPGEGTTALLLTADARIFAELRIVLLRPLALLFMPALLRLRLVRFLERVRVSADVAVRDATSELALLALKGPHSAECVGRALGVPAPELAPFACTSISHDELGRVLVVGAPQAGRPGLELLVEWPRAARLHALLLDAVRAVGGRPGGLLALENLRIQSGRPAFGSEMDESIVPAEVSFPGELLPPSIASDKRCFLGADALRRRGESAPQRRLAPLLVEGTKVPDVGTPLLRDGLPAGRVTSACLSSSGRVLALSMVTWSAAEHGTVLTGDGGLRAVVTRPPLET